MTQMLLAVELIWLGGALGERSDDMEAALEVSSPESRQLCCLMD